MQRLNMYIGGKWCESVGGKVFDAHNPATGEVIATLPEGTVEDADRAVKAANASKGQIAGMSVWDRSRLLRRIADVMERRRDELARVLSEDQGKPYHTEAQAEVSFAIAGFRETSEQIKWLETPVIPVEDRNKRVFSIRQPRGVYAVVTPWNFPINIPVEYLAPGLAAGNAIVWVPAPTTSVCAVKLMECLEEAGVPAGVVNLVTGAGAVVGDAIVAHPGTDAVGFTGSSATGESIARRAAGKPTLLELGGNGPTVVCEDADLSLAIPRIAVGGFFNAGQVCSATERILVHRKVYAEVRDGLVAAARSVRLGNPLQEGVTMGPLNNEPTALKMDRHIADAVARGAKVLVGGQRAQDKGSSLFYEPTVVDGMTRESLLNMEESFGPIAPLMMFDSDEEVLEIADSCNLGLVSSVFTQNLKRAYYYGERLRTGLTVINDHSNYWELHIPFGGVAGKRSGVGRLGGKYALMEMTDLRTIAIDLS